MESLQGKKVAILVADGFEQVELEGPRQALDEAGAETHIVSPAEERVKGWQSTEWGDEFDVDVQLGKADPDDYDALVLPGGVMNPDKLRMDTDALQFVRVLRGGQACRGDLSWSVDVDRRGRREGPQDDIVSVDSSRPAECRRRLGR